MVDGGGIVESGIARQSRKTGFDATTGTWGRFGRTELVKLDRLVVVRDHDLDRGYDAWIEGSGGGDVGVRSGRGGSAGSSSCTSIGRAPPP